jgi:hypothetical protein
MVEGSALEGQAPTPALEQEQGVRQEMLSWLAVMPNREKLPEAVKKAQVAVLQNLPADFWLDFKAHLLAAPKREAIYRRGAQKEVPVSEPELERFAAGELFEGLVRADRTIVPGRETRVAAFVRQFMADPARMELPPQYRFDYDLRNPDLVFVNEEGEIIGWTECKAGLLDKRSEGQLDEETGFRQSLKEALMRLRVIPEEELIQRGWNFSPAELATLRGLRISHRLRKEDLRLAIPRRGYRSNQPETIIKRQDVDGRAYANLVRLLNEVYQVCESPFSPQEIGYLNRRLMRRFRQEVREE